MIPDNEIPRDDLLQEILLGFEQASETPVCDGEMSAAELSLSLAASSQLAKLQRAVNLLRIAAGKGAPALGRETSSPADQTKAREPSRRYRLVSRLGQGGFGVVFLAYDQQLNRNVALKMPRPDILLTRSMVQRFLREARNVAKLDHPNIVPVLATEETALMPSIVYPFCRGPTLANWLYARREPLDCRLAATIVLLLAEAVQHAHSRGILHRDLKLTNVLLEPTADTDRLHGFRDDQSSWIPRVTDFGISKAIHDEAGETVTEAVLGTLEYMAPEQILGRASDIGSHSDVYSLGVMLYELLVKSRPYASGSGADMILKMKATAPPLIRKLRPEIPRDLEAIVARCLSFAIDDRYSAATGLAEDLGNFLAGRPVKARRNSWPIRVMRWACRQPLVATLSGLCATLAIIGVAGAIGYLHETDRSLQQLSATNTQLQRARDQASAERDRAASNASALGDQLYAADIAAAARALEDGDLPSYDILLSKQIKAESAEDRRELAWHHLWKKGHRSSRSISISNLPIYSFRFSKTGDLAVACGAQGRVFIYSAKSHQQVNAWDAAQGELNCAVFSEDDRMLSTAGDNGTVCIWNAATGEALNRFHAHAEVVFQSLFGRDDTLITCGNDAVIRVWNWKTGELLGELAAHTKSVQSISLSADGGQLYSASDDGTRCVWDLEKMRLLVRLPSRDTRILDVQPSRMGPWIFSSDLAGSLWRESIEANPEPIGVCLATVTDGAECLAVSPDGRRIVVANRTGMLYVVDLDENLQPIGPAENAMLGSWSSHRGRIYDLAFSPDGSRLNSVGDDGVWRIWEMQPLPTSASLSVREESLQTGGGSLAVAQVNEDSCVFSLGNNISQWNVVTNAVHRLTTTDAAISRLVAGCGNGMIFTGHHAGQVRAWRLEKANLEPVWSFAWPESPPLVNGLAYSQTRHWVATAVEQPRNALLLLDSDSGEVLESLAIPDGVKGDNDGGLAFSPDGKWLAAAMGNQVVLWELNSGIAKCLSGHTNTVTAIAFHPGGRLLASGSDDRSVRVWDIAAGKEVADLRYHQIRNVSVIFSPDGRSLLSADHGGTTAVWHTASRRLLLELDSHPSGVRLSQNWSGSRLFRGIGNDSIRADSFEISLDSVMKYHVSGGEIPN